MTCHYRKQQHTFATITKQEDHKANSSSMPCHRSHCPNTAKSHCCYSADCLHKLNNRLWRRHETLDRLETQLAAAESSIASITRRLEQECHRDCRQDCTSMRAARKFYDDQMECKCDRISGNSSRCSCRECAISDKDLEISVLRKKLGFAEAFEDFLRELDGKRRRCCQQLASK